MCVWTQLSETEMRIPFKCKTSEKKNQNTEEMKMSGKLLLICWMETWC